MSDSYPVGARVWVKMPDYPWWPGFVVDADAIQADVSLRAPEQDLCVQCLPSAAPSVMFVSSTDNSEIRPYRGREEDAALIAEGQQHPDCAAAVEEALTLFEAAANDAEKLAALANDSAGLDETLDFLMQMDDEAAAPAAGATTKAKRHDGLSSSSDGDGDDSAEEEEKTLVDRAGAAPEGIAVGEAAAADREEERRRQRKLQKKAEKAARKKAEKEKKKSARKRERLQSSEDDEYDDGSGDADARRTKKKKTRKAGGGAADPRDARQTSLDAYRAEAARPPAMGRFTESDADYFRRKLQQRRQTVSDAMLAQCAAKLREVTGDCLESDSYAEQEDALLELLRPLSSYNVSYEQLCTTGIGAVVGALLKPTFPARVQALANGILAYWFRTLPNQIQSELSADSEIDACSIETTIGSRSDGVDEALGAVGLHLFESFTEEEVYDAPPNTNVVEICKSIETLLRDNKDDLDTRVMVLTTIGDPRNAALRRGILDGKFTPQDILAHADDLNSLLRVVNKRGLRNIDTSFASQGSPTTPYAPFSPTGFGGEGRSSTGSPGFSPTGGGMGTFTTMYTCPQCGGAEAYRTEYTVQAHDNFPEIIRCRRCGTTWNAAE